MPAVLVEAGFLSNPIEERLLAEPEHRTAIAGALARAVRSYFEVRVGRPAAAGASSA
jgi:N-acetylmuramoyl-L-alanine amidase